MRYIDEFKKKEAWGMHALLDLQGCNPNTIRDAQAIKEFVYALCNLIGMKRFGDCVVVNFGEDARVAGYSMFQLIETSNISGHFANQDNSAYIDCFSCKPFDPSEVARFAAGWFEASKCEKKVVMRGGKKKD